MNILKIEKQDAIAIINAVAQQYAQLCNYCELKRKFQLAEYSVSWSDREIFVCEKHLKEARHVAANDGSDSDENPWVQSLNQPTAEQVFNRIFTEHDRSTKEKP